MSNNKGHVRSHSFDSSEIAVYSTSNQLQVSTSLSLESLSRDTLDLIYSLDQVASHLTGVQQQITHITTILNKHLNV